MRHKKRLPRLLYTALFLLPFYGLNAQIVQHADSAGRIGVYCGATNNVFKTHAIDTFSTTSSSSSFFYVTSVSPTFDTNNRYHCGKFDIYYEDFVAVAGAPLGGFADATYGAQRRGTFCAVLTYIQSVFDFSSIPASKPIRIHVNRSYYRTYNPQTSYPNFYGLASAQYFLGNGIVNGFLHDYVVSGSGPSTAIDPAVDPTHKYYHADMTINFDDSTQGAFTYQNDYSAAFNNCNISLYSVILHEMTHAMGWFSLVNFPANSGSNNLAPYASNAPYNQFTSLDTSIRIGSVYPSAPTTRLITGTIINSNSSAIVCNNNYWLNRFSAPENHPVYSGNIVSLGGALPISYISHLDDQAWGYLARQRISPGDQQEYVMGPVTVAGVQRLTYSKGEIEMLVNTLGYPLNSSYPTTQITNHLPVSPRMSGYTDYTYTLTFPETVTPDDTVTNNTSPTPVVININDPQWGFTDADNDTMSVYTGTLINYRGCGNISSGSGNNHNQLALSNSNRTITFTPRANFYGRAQFGFNLYDGKEKGGFVLFTILVKKGTNVSCATGSNMVLNGDFELGSEVKRVGTEESIQNTVVEEYLLHENKIGGTQFSDAHPYAFTVNDWLPAGSGIVVNNSYITCGNATILKDTAGNGSTSFPNAGNTLNAPNNSGQRYQKFVSGGSYYSLCSNLQVCHRYILEFDASGITAHPKIGFCSSDSINVNNFQYPVLNYTILDSISAGYGWTHKVIPFWYCGTPSDLLYISDINANNVFTTLYIDNISLKEDTAPPPLTATIAVTQSCQDKLTATASDSIECYNVTYTWSPTAPIIGTTNTRSILVPNATAQYSVVVNDGCRSSAPDTAHTDSIHVGILVYGPLTICQGSSVTMQPDTIRSNYTYNWYRNDTLVATNTIYYYASVAGNYKVHAHDAVLNCDLVSLPVTLIVNPLPTITITAPANFCAGQIISLVATSDSSGVFAWSPATGPGGVSCQNCASTTATPTATTTYYVSITAPGGCANFANTTVSLTPGITASISPASPSFCSGSGVVLSATTGSGYGYQWYHNGAAIGGATASTLYATSGGRDSVVISATGHCPAKPAVTVHMITTPPANITASTTTICAGYNTSTLSVVASPVYAYQWRVGGTNIPGATAATYTASATGNYSVIVSDSGCFDTSAINTLNAGTIYSSVQAYSLSVDLCMGTLDTFTCTVPGYSYRWKYNGTLTSDTLVTHPFTGANTGTYQVILYAPGYCPTPSPIYTIGLTTNACAACMVLNTSSYNSYTATTLSGTLSGIYYFPNSVTVNASATLNHAIIFMAPGKSLTVSSGVTLNIDSSHLFSCPGSMWNGIQATGSGSVINIQNNSLIEDATVAVSINGNNTLLTNNAIFNKNDTAVKIVGQSSPATYTTIQNTIFTSRKITTGYSYPSTWPTANSYKSNIGTGTTYPYYTNADTSVGTNNSIAPVGMYLSQLGSTSVAAYPYTFTEMTVGSTASASYQNVFDNLQNGVLGNNANVTLLNNEFISCNNGVNYNSNIKAFNGRLRIWNNGTSIKNRFYDCITGVVVPSAFEVVGQNAYMISNHTTSSPGTGVYGYNLIGGIYHDVHINNNMIINIANGISVIDPINYYIFTNNNNYTNPPLGIGCGVFITRDTVLAVPWGNTISNNEFVRVGISGQSVSNTTNTSINSPWQSDTNDIHDAYTGILLNNLRNTQASASFNFIRTRQDPSGGSQAGIYMWHNWQGKIAENTIKGKGNIPDDYWVGVYTDNNSGVFVACNATDSLRSDFQFVNTQSFHSGWYNNTMANSGKGFVLAGTIGTQGNATYPIGNVWGGATWNNSGNGWQTYVLNGVAPNNSKLYVDTMPSNNTSFPLVGPTYYYSSMNGLYTATGSNKIICVQQPLSRTAGDYSSFEDIATNNIVFGSNEGVTRWQAQLQLYQYMLMDSTLFDSSSVLPVFFDSAGNSRYAYITNIENYIGQGDMTSAKALIDTYVPPYTASDATTGAVIDDSSVVNNIVSNYLSFYGAYINYLDSAMTSSDSSTVATIANMCPDVNGAVVYQARALYAILYNNLTVFSDDACGSSSGHGRAINTPVKPGQQPLENMQLRGQHYRLYPNPTDGQINIVQTIPDAKPVHAEIWNAVGKQVYKNTLLFANRTKQLNLNLMPGLYLLQLTDNQGNEYTLKFVVN